MWPFKKSNEAKVRDVFMDTCAFEKKVEGLAISAAARVARGGVALQADHVLTEKMFAQEKEELRRKICHNDYSF